MVEYMNEPKDLFPAGRPPRFSQVEMTELVLPNDTNLLGNLLGGRLMHLIDIAAAMAASRHCNKVVATREVDKLDFRHPVRQGEIVILRARLIWVGRTSMRVLVKVYGENIQTGSVIKTNEATLTFVALNDEGCPTPVPPLLPETDQERSLFNREEARYQSLKKKG